jgi:hypothetical protein
MTKSSASCSKQAPHIRVLRLASDHAIGDDEHDINHPQENTDTASWIINIRKRDWYSKFFG